MTSADRNDLVPARSAHAQGKLEWVTPKISLMEAGAAKGKAPTPTEIGGQWGGRKAGYDIVATFGPS